MTPKTSTLLGDFLGGLIETSDSGANWDAFANFLSQHGIKQWSLISLPLFKNLMQSQESKPCLWETLNEKGFVNLHTLLSSEDRALLKRSLKQINANKSLQTLLEQGTLTATDAEIIKNIFKADQTKSIMTKTIMVCPAYGPRANNICLFYVHENAHRDCFSLPISTAFQSLHNTNSRMIEAQDTQRKKLSPREIQILEAIAQGKTNAEVAKALQISRYTINSYLKTIFLKMDCKDRTTAVLSGLARGVIG